LNGDMTAAEYLNSVSGKEKNPRRQLQGAVNRNNGAAFESIIIASCEMYKRKGIAYIEKTPEPVRVLKAIDRRSGQFKACYEKRAQPDFKGTLAGGRAICFEAKHTDTGKIEYERVTLEQRNALDVHHILGAQCFVLISFGLQEFFHVPWLDWQNMQALFGHKYMTGSELKQYQLKTESGNILFLN